MSKAANTPKTREAAALRRDRETRFGTATEAAAFFKIGVGTYRHWENGTRRVPTEWASKFATAYGTDPRQYNKSVVVFGGGGLQEHEVVGEVVVGDWHDSRFKGTGGPRETVYGIGGSKKRWAFRVGDQSLNKVFKKGWYALVESPPSSNARDYRDGQFLLVERRRGGLIEESIRRVEIHGDKCALACYSTELVFAGERIAYPPRSKDDDIVIVGVVVGGTFDL